MGLNLKATRPRKNALAHLRKLLNEMVESARMGELEALVEHARMVDDLVKAGLITKPKDHWPVGIVNANLSRLWRLAVKDTRERATARDNARKRKSAAAGRWWRARYREAHDRLRRKRGQKPKVEAVLAALSAVARPAQADDGSDAVDFMTAAGPHQVKNHTVQTFHSTLK